MSGTGRVDDTAGSSAFAVVDDLTARCVAILDAALVSVIVHGSLVSGDFVPSKSDIDLLVIVKGHLPRPHIDSLTEQAREAAQRHQIWLDFRVVTDGEAREPQREPSMELYVGRHRDVPGEIEVDRGPCVELDLLFEFSICLQHGVARLGLPPRELLGPVPLEWMLEVGDSYLARWQEIEFEPQLAELMVFTACRLWRLHDEGTHSSKSDAAAWVSEQDPTLVAPRVALGRRRLTSDEPLPRADVMTLLATVRRVLARPPNHA